MNRYKTFNAYSFQGCSLITEHYSHCAIPVHLLACYFPSSRRRSMYWRGSMFNAYYACLRLPDLIIAASGPTNRGMCTIYAIVPLTLSTADGATWAPIPAAQSKISKIFPSKRIMSQTSNKSHMYVLCTLPSGGTVSSTRPRLRSWQLIMWIIARSINND